MIEESLIGSMETRTLNNVLPVVGENTSVGVVFCSNLVFLLTKIINF
jgi:hypothetical protein